MGFSKLNSNTLDNISTAIKRWKSRDIYKLNKEYKSGIDSIEKAFIEGDHLTLEKQLHQLKSGRADSVTKDLSSDIWKTGDKIFHNKRMSDSYDLSPELRRKVQKL